MIKVILLIPVLVSICLTQSHLGDYYWRDFNWTIPSDAFASEHNNSQVYIVQAPVSSEGLIIGSLTNTSKVIYLHPDIHTAYNVTTNIKILCTPYPHNFVWISNLYNKCDSSIFRVYGGYKNISSSVFQFGSLAIGRVTTPHAVGFHDLEGDNYLYYCVGTACFHDQVYEELYYIL